MSFSDDIDEEEMVIEALDYDVDDFEDDPSFSIATDLDDEQLDDDELDEFDADGTEEDALDELKDTPKKKRRKVQVPEDKIHK